MDKIRINMLSKADTVDGQGVASAYKEQVNLIKEGANDLFDVSINKHGKFDIIHIHTVNPTYYLKMITDKKAVHVAYVHFLPDTLDGSIKLPRLFFNIFKRYVKSFYKKADEIVVVNPIFIDPLVELGIAKERITYIPNFVSHEDFYQMDKDKVKEIREKYEIPQEAFVVLGVGQVQYRKGVLDFVEVAKKNPDITFVWAGGFSFGKITDGYKELKQIIDNPPQNVKFIGIIKREEMNEIYNMVDCLFMPSYNELFPMSILEAVNVRKPIVLRDLDLYQKILFDQYTKAHDNEGFSKIIRKLKEDPEYLKEEILKSQYISNYYSKENVLKLWKDYYMRIYQAKKEQK